MISYFHAKHPGLYVYLFLITANALCLTFMQTTPFMMGMFSLLWAGFTLIRVLSLHELSTCINANAFISKKSNHHRASLGYDLSSLLRKSDHLKRGNAALGALHPRTLLWLCMGLCGVLYYCATSYTQLQHNHLIENLSLFFIIGLAFWGGQTYAYSNYASRLILCVLSILFGLSLYNITINANLSVTNINIHAVYMQLPFTLTFLTYSIGILCYAFVKKNGSWSNAILGILTLLILAFLSHTTNTGETFKTALWISGSGLFSIFWIRAHGHSRPRYVLYQGQ